ncbi:hypothetical protein lerEdw1_003100 [Lerista edwardsae]|nr:hypothetical protein lerEdw1_003100 [Lerista edwardsae]
MWPCFPLCCLPPWLGLCVLFFPLGHLCPAVCSCMDYHTINCQAQGLPRVPSPFPLDVRKLLIADNQIQEIPADFFIFYGDLVYLDFSNNSIGALQDGTFSGSSKLVYLDLSYNNLSQLEAGAFKTAEKLIKLSLGHNRLAEVDQAAFESLEQLQVLELNDNHLQTLDVAALGVLPNLRTIRLEGNPWLCDCDFASFFSWLEQNEGKLQKGLNEIQCTVPLEDRKIFLSELSQDSFRDCKFSLSLTDLIIIIFSGVAVSIAAIASSFVLALIVNCFQRCAPSKDDDDDDDDD